MSHAIPSARPAKRWYAAAAFAGAAPVVFLALPATPARVWYHVMCLGATLAAGVAVHRSAAAVKRPWWYFVAAIGLFSVRDVAMNWVPDASLPKALVVSADAVPLVVGYLLLCTATMTLIRLRSRGRDRDGVIDAAVVAAAVATIVWISVATRHPGGGSDYFITAAHAILDGLLIALAVRFMFTAAGALLPAWLLFGATFFGFLGNLGAVLATQTVQIAPHNWIAATWIAAWMCVPLAASHPRMVEVARDAGRGSDVATPRLIVLGTALLGAPAVVVSQAATNAPGRAAAAGSVVVTVLVLLRVIRLARALELVRLQQHAVLVLGQQALRGDSVEELVDAAEVALSAGLHGARAHVQLVDVGASAGPAEGVVDVRRELRTGSELLGSISVEPTPSATSREDDAFLDAVATTLSSAVVRSRAEERVRHGAMHDPLTALPNRVLLSERLELAATRARRAHGQIALLFIDIDGFKQVNDELGHDVGDAVLVETAGRLTRAVRAADLVARLAGDEFVVLCESIARRSDVMVVAQRILAAIRLASPATGTRPVSASIGVAFSDGFEPGEAFLKRADDAMYAAKRGGRDRVELAPVA